MQRPSVPNRSKHGPITPERPARATSTPTRNKAANHRIEPRDREASKNTHRSRTNSNVYKQAVVPPPYR
ncbi:hypothetical protein JXA12_01275 [Candidatus Woesearchaeota archaeon]|nr:hypothetical protein [Candidatus Woesearchaeota archaeon]